jgi:hypothetical protein
VKETRRGWQDRSTLFILFHMDELGTLYAMGIIAGLSKEAALDAAEKRTGDHCAAELWRKARIMGKLFEQYHAATSSAGKRTIRRNINQHLEELYSDVLCDEDMDWLKARVADILPVRPRKNYNFYHELICWYEVADKQIRKSGCRDCPWHKREDAEWQAKKKAEQVVQ